MNVRVSSSPAPLAHPPRSNPLLRSSSDAPPFPCITPSTVTCVWVVSFTVRPFSRGGRSRCDQTEARLSSVERGTSGLDRGGPRRHSPPALPISRRGPDVSSGRAEPVRDRGGVSASGDVELVEDVRDVVAGG